jgi:hypothetical protein
MDPTSKMHSDFWLDSSKLGDNRDHITLAINRRSISNFVTILTGKDIPVKYRVKGASCTDGKVVFITSDLSRETYDTTVGLALHEGSHILLTDFDILVRLHEYIPQSVYDKAAGKGIDKAIVSSYIKNLWNYVEDRYIDNYIYKGAPGYRGYYRSLYNKYFKDADTEKTLKSKEFCEECLEDYMFRIINLTNPGTRLGALNGLRDIAKEIGFSDIERLVETRDRLQVALSLFDIILENLGGPKKKKKEKKDYSFIPKSDGDDSPDSDGDDAGDDWPSKFDDMEDLMKEDEDDDESEEGGSATESTYGEDDDDDDDLFGGISTEADKDEDDEEEEEDDKKCSVARAVKDRAEKHLEEIQKYMDGETEKKEISESDANDISAIEESGTELVNVGAGLNGRVDCVVINDLTTSLMNSQDFPMTRNDYSIQNSLRREEESHEAVEEGLRLGRILGKKLKVRGETRITKYSRKKSGKIDRRIISELGFNSESVFYKLDIDQYKKANLHLSIDGSSSMHGNKWKQSMTCAVAIAKAASMIENIQVTISFRIVHRNGLPCIVMAYNSISDKISKIRRIFPYLSICGSTPEGLCFEAILDKIPPAAPDTDSYFLNFSDGQPCYSNKNIHYYSHQAAGHTKKQVVAMRNNGVKVLSYFISNHGGRSQDDLEIFRMMYGKDSAFIDVTDVTMVAKTMNSKFLEKSK